MLQRGKKLLGQNDDYDLYIRVRGDGTPGPGYECLPYRLTYGFDTGYCD